MKGLRATFLAAVCAAAVGLGFSLLPQDKKKAEPTSPSEEPAPQENLILSLNILRDAKVAAGAPVLIELDVSAGRGEKGPVESVLSKPGGSWGDLVTVEVRDSSGKPVPNLSISSLEKGEPSITLGRGQSGWLAWAIEPVNGKTLSAGVFTVRAILDKTPGDDPNEEKPSSPPSQLSVVAEAQLSQDDSNWASLAKIWILTYRSEFDKALVAAEAAATAAPEGWLFLDVKGDVLVRMGRYAEAVRAHDLAISKLKPVEANAVREPPFELIQKREHAAAQAGKAGK